jgi:hypothetical protein
VPTACEGLALLIDASSAEIVVCDVGAVVADLVAVEALARLQLTARRLGCELRLRAASPALADLIAFCGLREVLPCEQPGGLVEPGREAEEPEQARGVQERVDRGDPPL